MSLQDMSVFPSQQVYELKNKVFRVQILNEIPWYSDVQKLLQLFIILLQMENNTNIISC